MNDGAKPRPLYEWPTLEAYKEWQAGRLSRLEENRFFGALRQVSNRLVNGLRAQFKSVPREDIVDIVREALDRHADTFGAAKHATRVNALPAECIVRLAQAHIRSIAKNQMLSELRKRRWRDEQLGDEESLENPVDASSETSLEEHVDAMQRIQTAFRTFKAAKSGWQHIMCLWIDFSVMPERSKSAMSVTAFVAYVQDRGVKLSHATIDRHLKYGLQRLKDWIEDGTPLSDPDCPA